jgi:integrase/recombinase XerC/integrase/recombinase XerD
MTIKAAIADYLAEQAFRGHTAKTQQHYSGSLGRFTAFTNEDMELDSITVPLLRNYHAWLEARKNGTTTIQTYFRALRAFLNFCYEQEYMKEKIADKFRLPKAKRKEIDVLTDSEIKTLFACFNLRYIVHLRNYCICALMFDSGLRMHEVVTLSLAKVKLVEGYAIVDGKGNKERVIPLGVNTRRMLSRYIARRPAIADTENVFLMTDMRPITDNTIKQMFQKLKQRTGIKRIKAHLLRHTFATRYLENGGEMYSLQNILGHTTLEMVKRYIHTTHKKVVNSFGLYSPMDNLLQ